MNVVITDDVSDIFPGCITAFSVEDAIFKSPDDECFIIGGGSVYRQFLPIAERLYITHIHKSFEGDTFFPEINYAEWSLVEESEIRYDEKNNLNFSFSIYKRVKPKIPTWKSQYQTRNHKPQNTNNK